MARWLKQSTSVDVPIGPFVDQTDGFTAETALTLTQPDIRLKKNAAAWAQKNAAQTLIHEENGYYEVTLDATDTNTLGLLRLAVNETGALPVWEDFLVVSANVWDSLFSTDRLQVDALEINSVASAAAQLAKSAPRMVSGTVDNATFTPTTTQFEADDITEATADHYNGRIIIWVTGTLQDQAVDITDYALANAKGFFTVSTMTEAPANNDTFIIV